MSLRGLLLETGKWVDQLQELKLLQKCFFIIFMKEYGTKLSGAKENGGGYLNLLAISSAKYVTIALAPALLKEIKLSYITFSSNVLIIYSIFN